MRGRWRGGSSDLPQCPSCRSEATLLVAGTEQVHVDQKVVELVEGATERTVALVYRPCVLVRPRPSRCEAAEQLAHRDVDLAMAPVHRRVDEHGPSLSVGIDVPAPQVPVEEARTFVLYVVQKPYRPLDHALKQRSPLAYEVSLPARALELRFEAGVAPELAPGGSGWVLLGERPDEVVMLPASPVWRGSVEGGQPGGESGRVVRARAPLGYIFEQ